MATWTCPECSRTFGAVGRGHMCTPGLSIEEFLVAAPDFARPIFERVHECLVDVDDEAGGDLIVDPLAAKILFKNGPTFAIFDVKTKWVAVGFSLRRKLESTRLSRKTADYGNKFFHVVNVADADLVDDELADWLAEAYHLGDPEAADARRGDEASASSDPMLPDDIDFEITPSDHF